MKDFILKIALDNDAFSDNRHEAAWEVSRILRDIAEKIEVAGRSYEQYQNCYDLNGNPVGAYRLRFNDIQED